MDRQRYGILLAIIAILLIAPRQAEAQFTAHCLGAIRDTSGNVIVDLGTVATYNALFPQNGTHQDQCVSDVSAAASNWLKNTGQMCHAFLTASSNTLIIFYKLGSLPWRDSGHATDVQAFNYPNVCFNLSAQILPSYYIFTLIYTPPGCTPSTTQTGYKCGSGSTVSYASGSSAGSTVSIDDTVALSTSLTATIDPAFSLGTGFSETSASGSSITISKATNSTVTWPSPGPAGADGINHDFDQFFILLNPLVAVKGWHDPVTGQNHAQWSLKTKNGAPARIQRVQVSYLRCALAGIGPRPGNAGNGGGSDPSGSCTANPFLQMPGPPDASASNGWLPGLTYNDYSQILAQDLFWNAASHPVLIPTSRFVQQSTDFTYDAAGGPFGSSCAVQTQSITNSNSTTNTSSTQTQYQASMTFGGNATLLKSTTSMTWTNKTSNSLTNANTQTATAVVACTSASWPGPFFVTTYYDTLYGTFLFALDDGSGFARLLHGTVADADGDLVPHTPLRLVIGNKTFQTFTRNNGTFLFHLPVGQTGSGTGNGTLTVGTGTSAIAKSVSVGPQAATTVTIPTPPPALSVSLGHAAPPPQPVPTPLPNIVAAEKQVATATLPLGPLTVAVTNVSLFAVAKNVTVTSIQGRSVSGAPLIYSGALPAKVPGGTALFVGRTASLPLTFNGNAKPLSLTVTVKADNLAPFTTTLLQPSGPNPN